jgi:hypothetical protein
MIILCRAVCGRTGVKLLVAVAASRIDHQAVFVERNARQKDWKDHKDDDCYVYDAVPVEVSSSGGICCQNKQKTCTICFRMNFAN